MAVATGIGKIRREEFDYFLLALVLSLAGIGLLMIYSTSFIQAQMQLGDGFYFFRRQLLFFGFGFVLLFTLAFLDYRLLRPVSGLILGGAVLLLLLVLIPGIGSRVGGSARWLRAFGFSFQPTEFAKLALVLWLAYFLSRSDAEKTDRARVLLPLAVSGGVALCILLEPDFGSTVIIGFLLFVLLAAAGVNLRFIFILGLAALPAAAAFILLGGGYRLKRIMIFLNPWRDPEGSGFQIIQSFVAFAHGGLFGQGLGEGSQKLFFLPEAHTDFIFSVIGEETGFLGVAVILALYLFFVQRGIRIALRTPDLFGTLLAFGIVVMISGQALLNMGVVLGLLPTKGLVLPFVSYGGTSLVVNLAAVGLLLSVAAHPARR